MMRYVFLFFLLLAGLRSVGQDSAQAEKAAPIYDRPFVVDSLAHTRTAIGGYLEGNTNYFSEAGVPEGFSMEMRRFNIFLFSRISQRIRFISELEFEHGTEEINLETALLDMAFAPSLNFRAGVVLPAIGLVNTDHDSPKWAFIDRPLSSTQLIPTTLSEVGFGLHGKFFPSEKQVLSYQIYAVNGLRDGIILNEAGRTHVPAGKGEGLLAGDNNGIPMVNGHLGYRYRGLGKLGVAYYGGIYNRYRKDGEQVAPKRALHMLAFDYRLGLGPLTLQGELVNATIDVPEDISELYGTAQWGGFIDLIHPVLEGRMLRFEDAVLNASLRLERVDLNMDDHRTNIQGDIGSENSGVAVGLGFRPRSGTILRLNYRMHWLRDFLGNPPVRRAGIQFGLASYF